MHTEGYYKVPGEPYNFWKSLSYGYIAKGWDISFLGIFYVFYTIGGGKMLYRSYIIELGG